MVRHTFAIVYFYVCPQRYCFFLIIAFMMNFTGEIGASHYCNAHDSLNFLHRLYTLTGTIFPRLSQLPWPLCMRRIGRYVIGSFTQFNI
jgi:hypothetical protein